MVASPECGSGFTLNLEGMFKDIEISRDFMTAFNSNTRIKATLKGFELYVNILTASFWPTYQPDQIVLPSEVTWLSRSWLLCFASMAEWLSCVRSPDGQLPGDFPRFLPDATQWQEAAVAKQFGHVRTSGDVSLGLSYFPGSVQEREILKARFPFLIS